MKRGVQPKPESNLPMEFNVGELAQMLKKALSDPMMRQQLRTGLVTPVRIRMKTQGNLGFQITGEESKVFDGVIVSFHPANAYWSTPEVIKGRRPECWSFDAIKPDASIDVEVRQAETCIDCPRNQFGSSGKGRGKACKNMVRLYILRKGKLLPSFISSPPTSRNPVSEYSTGLMDMTPPLAFNKVITRFSTIESQSGSFPVTLLQMEMVSELPKDLLPDIDSYRKELAAFVRAPITAEDFTSESPTGDKEKV